MAVNTGNENAPNSAMAQALAAAKITPQAAQPTNPTRPTAKTTASIFDMNNDLNPLMARNTVDAALQHMYATVKEVIAAEPKLATNDAINLFAIDATENNIPYGILSLCLDHRYNGNDYRLVYNWIVAAAGEGVEPRVQQIGNQEVSILTTPGDTYSNGVWAAVEKVIARDTRPGIQIMDIGASVVEDNVDLKNQEIVRAIVQNAVAALGNNANKLSANPRVITPESFGSDTTLVARLDFSIDSDVTASGQPVRANAVISTTAYGASDNETMNRPTTRLSVVSGFINLVYVGQPEPQPYVYGVAQPPRTQAFMPQLVITSTDPMTNYVSDELQLMALASTLLLTRGNSWAQVFRPKHNLAKGVVDLTDIGAIGCEISFNPEDPNERLPINTKLDDFNLGAFLDATVIPELIFSMDIPEAGDLTWLQSVFLAAANGSVDAANTIVATANNITNNHFGRIWKELGSPAIMMPNSNRIHLGYYSPQDGGNSRDLRDIDYIAQLNLNGKKDLASVIAWCDTFDHTDVPEAIRLERRLNLLRDLLGNAFKVTGYAARVIFNPLFITALSEALAAAKLGFVPENIQYNQAAPTRGNVLARQWGVTNTSAGLFREQTRGGGAPGAMHTPRNPWF